MLLPHARRTRRGRRGRPTRPIARRRGAIVAALLAVAGLAATASDAGAQQIDRGPIGVFVADVRVAMPRFTQDEAVANALSVDADNLPTRGLGLSTGVHVYALRRRSFAVGVGGELVVSSGSRTAEPTTEGGVDGPTVETRFRALSPQLSLNFGSANGWSYVSGGIGFAHYTTELATLPVADPDGRTRALNYGGGARWFARDHLAFTFDVRFYRLNAQPAAIGRPAYPGVRLIVLSGGISIK